jgi:hypothetical protein
MYTLDNTRDILDSLIDGHPDDAFGTSLSEVLTFIKQQDFENKQLRRALLSLINSRSAVLLAEGQSVIFVTSDGYALYYQSKKLEGSRDDCNLGPEDPATGIWVDSLVPELQDSFWYGDMLGPWDTDTKERLEGILL